MQFVCREQRCCILIPMPLFHEVNKPQFILSTCLGSLFDGCCWWGGLSTRAEGLKREAQPSWLWCGADFGSWAPSPSLPVLSQGGFVLLGPLSRDWPWHGSTSLLLCGLNVPPWPPSPGLTLGFSLGIILLLWLCLVDLSGYFICFSHLHPDRACFDAQVKPVQKAEQVENDEFVLFSPACSLSLCFFWNLGNSGARLHPAGRDPQPQATRVWV